MTSDQVDKYRSRLQEIVTENETSALDNALRHVLQGDQVALKEAITCNTAAECYQKALELFNEILEPKDYG